jgi:hypothetical protein
VANRPQSAIAAQNARRRQLDDIRLQRPLTDAERVEDDRLANLAYMRAYAREYRQLYGSGAR